MTEKLLNKSQVCRALGISWETLTELNPPSYRLAKRRLYRLSEVEQAINQTREENNPWVSTKLKARRTGTSTSRSRIQANIIGFAEALRLSAANRP